LIDTIPIKEDDISFFASNKYIRCVYHMSFANSIKDDLA